MVPAYNPFFDDALTPDIICEEHYRGIQLVPNAFIQLDVPMICAINGSAIGAELDLTCTCYIHITSETASSPRVLCTVDLVAGDGSTWLLLREVGMVKASKIAFAGKVISEQEALACDVVSRVVTLD